MRTERDWDDLQAQFWSTVAENEKLRARLAAADAVVAALPSCKDCVRLASYEYSWEGMSGSHVDYVCDDHRSGEYWDEMSYADELRAYLALAKEGGK